jgi:hypothetical protein
MRTSSSLAATDPKTRPRTRHAPGFGVARRFSEDFRAFSPPPRNGSSFALIEDRLTIMFLL